MAVLLQYNLTSDFAPSTTAANINGGTATSNLLSSFTRGAAGYASDSVSSAGPATNATSAATAITNGSYFFVTITPAAGFSMSLTTLTINMARGGSATPRGYDIRSSIDSFAASLGTADLLTQRTTWTAVSIDLSAAGFQNVITSITFNIYVYAPSTVNVIDWDDLIINGTTATAGTVEQEGFRFRNDDGSETTATWLAAQDTNITQPKTTNTRLRVALNSTLNRGSETYRLEYRAVGGSTWTVITT
jgi:hypothetical protein